MLFFRFCWGFFDFLVSESSSMTSTLLLLAQDHCQVLFLTELFNIFLAAVFGYITVFIALKMEPAVVADIL